MVNEDSVVICKNAIPINSTIINKEDQGTFANISYLCKTEDDKLFIINRIYKVEDEEDALSFECLPFAEFETDYITGKIENRWLSNCLTRFTTNFQFYIDEDFFQVYTYGIESKEGTKCKIKMSHEVFMSLLFLDKYPIKNDSDNDHDLSLAILNSSKPLEHDAEFFVATSAKVLELADTTFRPKSKNIFSVLKNAIAREELLNTTIAVKLELGDYYNLENSVQLLIPLDVGEVLSEEKFQGKTFEDLQLGYIDDPNHYVGNLMVSDMKFFGINKKFMIIRGENKNKEVKIFLIDEESKEIINTQINQR